MIKLELTDNSEKALKLVLEHRDLMERIKLFVGETSCEYDGGLAKLREVATNFIVEAAKEAIEQVL